MYPSCIMGVNFSCYILQKHWLLLESIKKLNQSNVFIVPGLKEDVQEILTEHLRVNSHDWQSRHIFHSPPNFPENLQTSPAFASTHCGHHRAIGCKAPGTNVLAYLPRYYSGQSRIFASGGVIKNSVANAVPAARGNSADLAVDRSSFGTKGAVLKSWKRTLQRSTVPRIVPEGPPIKSLLSQHRIRLSYRRKNLRIRGSVCSRSNLFLWCMGVVFSTLCLGLSFSGWTAANNK